MPPNKPVTEPCLYAGHVMHIRLRPFKHQFRYRVFSLLLDIDRIEETVGHLRLLRLDRFGLLAFYRRDHGPRDGSPLRPWVDRQLAMAGQPPAQRVLLLSFPRIFGYAFNPLSVYFCEDGTGALTSIVYQVKNTFGDQHAYVLAAPPDADGRHRHQEAKDFFVSPFLDIEQIYHFTVCPPGPRLSLKIRQHDADGPADEPWLIATQNGTRRSLNDRTLLSLWLAHPLMTFKVFAAIHWQALKLAIKGAAFRPYRGAYPHKDVGTGAKTPARMQEG